MARYLFQLTSVTPAGSYVRLDSASGSTSPTAVSPTDSAYVFPGAILHSDATTGALPTVAAGVATLYQKTLSATGAVTATATLTGTLVGGPGPGSLDPQTWPVPYNTDPTGLNGTYAPISSAKQSITYNADGTVNTVTETATGAVTTYTYNTDGTVATESRLLNGVTTTRTFTYTNGNLTGVS